MAFDGDHDSPEPREDGCLVPGASAELEHSIAGSRSEQLGHARDHVRLADALAGIDRDRLIGIGAISQRWIDEAVARYGLHGLEYPPVLDPAGAHLFGDHARSISRGPTLPAHGAEDSPG